MRLNLSDRFNKILVERDEFRLVLVVDHDVSEVDEKPLLLVDGIGDTVAHRRDEEVADVDAVHSSDANANLLALGHDTLLPAVGWV